MRVNYKALRSKIIRSLRRQPVKEGEESNELDFCIDIEKLKGLAEEIGLTPILVGNENSYPLSIQDIPWVSENYKGSSLSWFDSSKEILVIAFVNVEELEQIESVDDNVKDLANIYANCSVYTSTIVSYKSNDPKFAGRLSYEIATRANKYALEHNKKEETEEAATEETTTEE